MFAHKRGGYIYGVDWNLGMFFEKTNTLVAESEMGGVGVIPPKTPPVFTQFVFGYTSRP